MDKPRASVAVAGAGDFIGAAIARRFAAEGYRVLATCLDPQRAGETRAIKGDISVRRLDVSDHAAP